MESLKFVSGEWLVPLLKRLVSIRDDRREKILAIEDDFVLNAMELSRRYVEPDCQHRNPADHWEDEEPVSFVRMPIFKTIEKFLSGSTSTRPGRNQLFVLGDAGMGKSSLLFMIKLMHLTSFWPKNYDCELIRLGRGTLTELKKVVHPSRTILLLDALDEDNTALGRVSSRVLEILKETRHFRRVIISCRPQFLAVEHTGNSGDLRIDGFHCPMLYLSLFSDEQISTYLDRAFPRSIWNLHKWIGLNRQKEEIRKAIKSIESLRLRPLLLSYAMEIPENFAAMDEYSAIGTLIERLLSREVFKISESINNPPSESELLSACILIAIHMNKERKREVTITEISKILEDEACGPAAFDNLAFTGRSLFNRTVNNDDVSQYRFSHIIMGDYLVARGIREGIADDVSALKFSDQLIDFMGSPELDTKKFLSRCASGPLPGYTCQLRTNALTVQLEVIQQRQGDLGVLAKFVGNAGTDLSNAISNGLLPDASIAQSGYGISGVESATHKELCERLNIAKCRTGRNISGVQYRDDKDIVVLNELGQRYVLRLMPLDRVLDAIRGERTAETIIRDIVSIR